MAEKKSTKNRPVIIKNKKTIKKKIVRPVKKVTATAGSTEKNNLFFGGGFNYLALSEVAKGTSFSASYLVDLARLGKLKAFKIGDDWLTTKEWFNEFQKTIKSKVEQEIVLSDNPTDNFNGKFESRWVKLLPKKKKSKFNIKLSAGYSLTVVLLVALLGSSVVFVQSQPGQASNLLTRAGKISDGRFIVANRFLTITNLAYRFPLKAGDRAQLKYFSFLNGFSRGTLDSLSRLNGSILKGGGYAASGVGPVSTVLADAGERLKYLKFSDEKITQSWHNFVLSNDWSSKMALGWEKVSQTVMGTVFPKGQVAGASASK